MAAAADTHVVTCFLRHRGAVLLLRRSDAVGSYPGRWGAVAGHADGDPEAAAHAEIEEETGLGDAITLVREGAPFPVPDDALGVRWIVHPFLFDCAHRDVVLNEESQAAAWVMPTEILRRDTVPQLRTAYERVAPSVATVASDRTHGSAYVAQEALAVLRDRAGGLRAAEPPAAHERLRQTALALVAARPAMAALRNQVHCVMHATRPGFAPAAVEAAAHAAIGRAIQAQAAVARHAAQQTRGRRVLTLSRSGTVLQALQQADPPPTVFVAESRPDREGVYVAEALAAQGLGVTLLTDAAIATTLARASIDAVLVGADTVLPAGDVVNKTGTRGAALAAHHEGIPVLVATTTAKIASDATPHLEAGASEAVYDGAASVRALNPTFDVTPAARVARWITEEGALGRAAIRARAKQHRQWAAWAAPASS